MATTTTTSSSSSSYSAASPSPSFAAHKAADAPPLWPVTAAMLHRMTIDSSAAVTFEGAPVRQVRMVATLRAVDPTIFAAPPESTLTISAQTAFLLQDATGCVPVTSVDDLSAFYNQTLYVVLKVLSSGKQRHTLRVQPLYVEQVQAQTRESRLNLHNLEVNLLLLWLRDPRAPAFCGAGAGSASGSASSDASGSASAHASSAAQQQLEVAKKVTALQSEVLEAMRRIDAAANKAALQGKALAPLQLKMLDVGLDAEDLATELNVDLPRVVSTLEEMLGAGLLYGTTDTCYKLADA